MEELKSAKGLKLPFPTETAPQEGAFSLGLERKGAWKDKEDTIIATPNTPYIHNMFTTPTCQID
uniref:Uncharacterized protein n=1 Tax=Glycine max TaxID=3847 RepID=C6TKM3_SOYBN|nr:unknown [Glycine max]